jgi:hypothetical protein
MTRYSSDFRLDFKTVAWRPESGWNSAWRDLR